MSRDGITKLNRQPLDISSPYSKNIKMHPGGLIPGITYIDEYDLQKKTIWDIILSSLRFLSHPAEAFTFMSKEEPNKLPKKPEDFILKNQSMKDDFVYSTAKIFFPALFLSIPVFKQIAKQKFEVVDGKLFAGDCLYEKGDIITVNNEGKILPQRKTKRIDWVKPKSIRRPSRNTYNLGGDYRDYPDIPPSKFVQSFFPEEYSEKFSDIIKREFCNTHEIILFFNLEEKKLQNGRRKFFLLDYPASHVGFSVIVELTSFENNFAWYSYDTGLPPLTIESRKTGFFGYPTDLYRTANKEEIFKYTERRKDIYNFVIDSFQNEDLLEKIHEEKLFFEVATK